jgi:uncharacterized membrane protein YphA (DoxX/SURF4 family)
MQIPARTNFSAVDRLADFGFKMVFLLFPTLIIYISMNNGQGCGDLPIDFRFYPIAIAIAFGLALVWCSIDKQKYRYSKLEYILQVLIRYFLAFTIMQYGAAKVVDMQFSSSINGLDTRVIDLGPMGIAWTFFGFSYEYEFFIGCGQIIAAILLLYRRTTTLGAVLMVTIMANIVFVNFSFNVCVKFFSSTYLAMAIYLLLDDAGRLARFFIFNQVVEPRTYPQLFSKKWVQKTCNVISVLAFIVIVGLPIGGSYYFKQKMDMDKHTPIYGVWTVDSVHASSDSLNAKLLADSSGWKKIIFENRHNAYIKSWKNTRGFFNYEEDTAKHSLTMKQNYPDSSVVLNLKYQISKDTMILRGLYNKDSVYARMYLQRKYFIRN